MEIFNGKSSWGFTVTGKNNVVGVSFPDFDS